MCIIGIILWPVGAAGTSPSCYPFSMNINLYPLESLAGPTNMATDEILLEQAVEDVASLRFYTWSGPTLSLGYFQPASCRFDNPRLQNLPWVRRSSGGGALVHHHEVTYALALPPGKAWQTAEPNWTCRFHHIITAALQTVGIVTRSVQCGEEQKLDPTLCFLHQTPGDLLSQQRSKSSAVLNANSAARSCNTAEFYSAKANTPPSYRVCTNSQGLQFHPKGDSGACDETVYHRYRLDACVSNLDRCSSCNVEMRLLK